MVVLFAFSSQSAPAGVELLWDKVAHVLAYALLGLLCLRATHDGLTLLRARPTLLALALSVGYGLFDELHQMQVPGRVASVADWLADAIGSGVAVALYAALAALARRFVPAFGTRVPEGRQ
jgi:VanZ family protein